MRHLDYAMVRIVRGMLAAGEPLDGLLGDGDVERVQLDEPTHFPDKGTSDYPCILIMRSEAERSSSRGQADERIDFAEVSYMVVAIGQDATELDKLRQVEEALARKFQACDALPEFGGEDGDGVEGYKLLDGSALPAGERTWYVLWGDVERRVQADDAEEGKRYWTRGVMVKLDCQGRT